MKTPAGRAGATDRAGRRTVSSSSASGSATLSRSRGDSRIYRALPNTRVSVVAGAVFPFPLPRGWLRGFGNGARRRTRVMMSERGQIARRSLPTPRRACNFFLSGVWQAIAGGVERRCRKKYFGYTAVSSLMRLPQHTGWAEIFCGATSIKPITPRHISVGSRSSFDAARHIRSLSHTGALCSATARPYPAARRVSRPEQIRRKEL